MMWINKKLGLSILAVALALPAGVGLAQRRDQYLYDKIGDQERHFQATDASVKELERDLQALRNQINEWKDYAVGFAGCFTLFVGFLKYLGRKGDKSA